MVKCSLAVSCRRRWRGRRGGRTAAPRRSRRCWRGCSALELKAEESRRVPQLRRASDGALMDRGNYNCPHRHPAPGLPSCSDEFSAPNVIKAQSRDLVDLHQQLRDQRWGLLLAFSLIKVLNWPFFSSLRLV